MRLSISIRERRKTKGKRRWKTERNEVKPEKENHQAKKVITKRTR
jgi:hypothetical protein